MERRAQSLIGARLDVLAERLQQGTWVGRSQREAPEVDGDISFTADRLLRVGDYVSVRVTGSHGADLLGEAEGTAA
jgi:ribosomal protein S12 methylthiotransferase